MPLTFKRVYGRGAVLAVWRMDETEGELERMARPYGVDTSGFRSESRRKEKLCTAILVGEITGTAHFTISHDSHGKPSLDLPNQNNNPYNISISHTKGYAVVSVSKLETVALDIEHRSDRVGRVARKFLRADENPNGIGQTLACWCAKETAYKYFSGQQPAAADIRVCSMPPANGGCFRVENIPAKAALQMCAVCGEDYLLVYACAEERTEGGR